MIACVIHGAKELKIENRPEPPLPQDGEVLVRFGAGGICGSDLHYYHEGGILDFKIREPLILGHEVAGKVVEIGPGVTKVSVRDRVAVNPLRSCYRCVYCLSGHPNLCLNTFSLQSGHSQVTTCSRARVSCFAFRRGLTRMESKNLDESIGMTDFDYATRKASSLDIANTFNSVKVRLTKPRDET
jgi:threonine dehydrogenase-like Zn-dependent dehydrogenase